jgi:hydrogenase maturation protease
MNDDGALGTLVIGLGNPIMADDGFGLAVLAELEACWRVPGDVELVDGGTWGLRLLPLIERAQRVLFLDAVDRGAEPGTLFLLRDDELPRALCLKLSPHQIDLREVLAIAAFRGTTPRSMAAAGAQPAEIELRSELSATLAGRVHDVARLAVDALEAWGHVVPPAEAATCR